MGQELIKENCLHRDAAIDILRFIGISLIILAHVSPPETLIQLRTFDVPLMLFISGLTLLGKSPDFSFRYFRHRAVRLLLPVYTFLTAYFLLVFILHSNGASINYSTETIVRTYLLLDGFGFVWVIRVFLLVALVTPILLYVRDKCSTSVVILIVILILFPLSYCVSQNIMMNNFFVREVLYYAIGYSTPLLIALKFAKMNLRQQLYTVTLFVVLLLFDGILLRHLLDGGGKTLLVFNHFKYPPQSYYLLYGITCSMICYLFIVKCKLYRYFEVFSFIGRNTIWIYLYHIPLIQITHIFNIAWFPRYLIVYGFSFLLCYIQVKVVMTIESHYECGNRLKFLKG